METVGVALAVVPLMVIAVEHFNHAIEPLRRYTRYSHHIDRFQRALELKRTIFKVSCAVILTPVVEEGQADIMLNDASHALWKDDRVNENLRKQLGDSLPVLKSVIDDIIRILQELQANSEKYISVIRSSKHSFGDRKWREYIKTKLTFAFSQEAITKAFNQLESKNNQLLCLYDQTKRLDEQLSMKSRTKKKQDDLQKFHIVQKASRNLYRALAHGCMKHTEHATSLCLDAIVKEDELSTNPSVKFELNYTSQHGLHYFFAVESTVHSTNSSGRLVRFADMQNTSKVGTSGTVNQPAQNISGDLCDHLQSEINRNLGSSHITGVLQGSNCPRIFICKSSNHPSVLLQKKCSLREILKELVDRGRSARLSYSTQLRLTRQISTALLQYYTTPWIIQRWKSGDIYFHGTNEASLLQDTGPSYLVPHISVQVRRGAIERSQSEDFPLKGIAHNEFLYGLGIILIEVAYSTPMSDLILPEDAVAHGPKLEQWHAAQRLVPTVSRHMGIEYGEIVRKCLRSNFACACDDLGDSKLQEAFHSDVIVKLQDLERNLTTLLS